jgi:tetratricopeptide (TPR) repeat protein
MEIPLDRSGRKRFVLVSSLAMAALLSFQAGEVWLANQRINSQDLDSIERGAALLPGDGEAWDRVGRFEEYDFADPNLAAAIGAYHRAIRDDPNSSYYWLDLGGAYELAGDDALAQSAYEQARVDYPLSALVAWTHGNFLLRRQAYDPAFAEIQRSVRADPRLLPLAISRVWRSSENVNQLLDRALPADTNAYFQAIDFFVSIHEMDPGIAVWNRLVALNQSFVMSRSFPFMDELISENRADDARRVWQQALEATGLADAKTAAHSVIWDGNFVHEFSNGGLGWRWHSLLGAAIDFDSPPSSEAGRSVRIDFGGGSNPDLQEPAQIVVVDSGRTYHFHAEMKTEGITTESGLQFSISDPSHASSVNATTDNFTGTHGWTSMDADLKTAPDSHFVNIRLMRSPSRLFDNKLAGTVWIANISLVPSDGGARQASP